uniref:Predicted protein n=1 Tax=Hordeum vulgare subsp. vulgare TaxID=112509 RepID=F2EBC6_HORVV|nr:predicted protein [Hordeum vulgare subsp. vulgare]
MVAAILTTEMKREACPHVALCRRTMWRCVASDVAASRGCMSAGRRRSSVNRRVHVAAAAGVRGCMPASFTWLVEKDGRTDRRGCWFLRRSAGEGACPVSEQLTDSPVGATLESLLAKSIYSHTL